MIGENTVTAIISKFSGVSKLSSLMSLSALPKKAEKASKADQTKAFKSKSKKEEKAELKSQSLRYGELKKRLSEAKLELNAALDNFNYVTDPKLTDVYIYKMRSEQARYEYILNEIKAVSKNPSD